MRDRIVGDKLTFTDVLRFILYHFFGPLESEVYAYYEKYCPMLFKVEAHLVESNPYYFKLQGAIRCFEFLYLIYEEIVLFDIIPLQSGDQVKVLSRVDFFEHRPEFYENEGRRRNSSNLPMSILYVSSNILEYLYRGMDGSFFPRGFLANDFAEQIERIYLRLKTLNYLFTEETTVKVFFRDILEPLYPEMSLNDQNFFWRLFKPKDPSSLD